MTVFALAFVIGVLNGLRSFTPPAAAAWAAHLRWMKLQGALALIGSLPVVAIFTLLAQPSNWSPTRCRGPRANNDHEPRRTRRHGRADRRMRRRDGRGCRGRPSEPPVVLPAAWRAPSLATTRASVRHKRWTCRISMSRWWRISSAWAALYGLSRGSSSCVPFRVNPRVGFLASNVRVYVFFVVSDS